MDKAYIIFHSIFINLLFYNKIIIFIKINILKMNEENEYNPEHSEKLDDSNIHENNELMGIDDIITNNADLVNKTIDLNINPTNDAINSNSITKDINKSNENEPLTVKHDSGVVQIPLNEANNSSIPLNEDTLNESILTTIYRDLYLIYKKLKIVIMPFASKEDKNYHIMQWDLWGPLLLDMTLACTLAINAKEKSNIIILIFVIFWLGGVILFLNANFLGVKSSIFQMFCLLGYCLFPLNLSAIFVTIFKLNNILRFIIVGITALWSIYSSSDFLRTLTNESQKYLVLYPCILFYLYISWFIIN